jgi:hypothetical protein
MNWIEIAVYAVATLLFVYIAIDNIRVRLLYKKNVQMLLQLTIDNNNLINEYSKLVASTSNSGAADREGFIKFLSESRDMAFSYIEKFQAALSEFNDAKKSGNVEKIAQSTTKLLDLLPEETTSRND